MSSSLLTVGGHHDYTASTAIHLYQRVHDDTTSSSATVMSSHAGTAPATIDPSLSPRIQHFHSSLFLVPSLISRESRTSKNTKQGKGLLNNSTLAWINSNIPAIDVEEFYIG